MATTSDTSIIDRGFIQEFYKRLKGIFAAKEDALSTKVIDVAQNQVDALTTYHIGKRTKGSYNWIYDSDTNDTDDTYYTLYIDKDVTIIKLNGQTLKCVAPIASQSFKNGKRIILMGEYTLLPASHGTAQTDGGNGDYILDPYLYHRLSIPKNDNSGIATSVNISNGNINATVYNSSSTNSDIAEIQSQTNWGTPQKFEEFIYWNKRWYSKGYTVFPTASGVASSNYLPASADAVYQYCQGFATSESVSTALEGYSTSNHKHGNISSDGKATDTANAGKYLKGDGTWSTPLDNKVKQASTTTSSWRPVILGNQSSSTENKAITEVTESVYANQGFEYQSSTGTLKSNIFKGLVDAEKVTNVNTAVPTVSTTAGDSKFKAYIAKANASNVPDPSGDWHILSSTYTNASNAFRCVQLAIASNSSDMGGFVYVRNGWSTNNTTWNWGSWTWLLVPTDLNGYLSKSSGGKVTGSVQLAGGVTGVTTMDGVVSTRSVHASPLVINTNAAGVDIPYMLFTTGSFGSEVTQAQLTCRPTVTGSNIIAEMGPIYSSKYGYLGNYTNYKYTVTETDGLCGMLGHSPSAASPGELTLPKMSSGYSIGRHFWVAVQSNSLPVKVIYTAGSDVTNTITVGNGQACEFVCSEDGYWKCLTQGLPIIKTLAGTTYSLTVTDQVTVITGTGKSILNVASGWDGRRVLVAANGGTMSIQHYYKDNTGSVVSTTKDLQTGRFTEYIFLNGAWCRTAGANF